MKQTIRVFPDYCSSGLWGEKVGSGMIDENNFRHSILDNVHLLALKYWHLAWEESMQQCKGCKYSTVWQEQWETDGKALVESFNTYQDIYEFVYIGGNF